MPGTFYDRTVMMERLVAVDERVRNFINRYADGIIVNVGCELDTMFSRVDNGRIKWYNVDAPGAHRYKKKIHGDPGQRGQHRKFNI